MWAFLHVLQRVMVLAQFSMLLLMVNLPFEILSPKLYCTVHIYAPYSYNYVFLLSINFTSIVK